MSNAWDFMTPVWYAHKHTYPTFSKNEGIMKKIKVTAPEHGIPDGALVDIRDVVGMTEVNGGRYMIELIDVDTFYLLEPNTEEYVEGLGYSAYISGGEVSRAYTNFANLTWLEGKEVAILGNGEVFPRQTVSGGVVSLSRACSKISVGLPYESDFETLNIEQGLKDGTSQGRPIKVSNVTFRLLNSRGGWIGPDDDHLHEAFIPTRDSLGQPAALFSGDIKENLAAGYEKGGRIFYQQRDPLPVTISCVIPEFTVF